VGGNTLGRCPASTNKVHKPVDLATHAALVARLNGITPAER
jgi:hypothetical protein